MCLYIYIYIYIYIYTYTRTHIDVPLDSLLLCFCRHVNSLLQTGCRRHIHIINMHTHIHTHTHRRTAGFTPFVLLPACEFTVADRLQKTYTYYKHAYTHTHTHRRTAGFTPFVLLPACGFTVADRLQKRLPGSNSSFSYSSSWVYSLKLSSRT
jgi:hypothetical protein